MHSGIVSMSLHCKVSVNVNCCWFQLSAYIVHMLSEWPSAIEDVINTFQNQQIPNVSNETQLWILLEVLQAIPEEVGTLSIFHRYCCSLKCCCP